MNRIPLIFIIVGLCCFGVAQLLKKDIEIKNQNHHNIKIKFNGKDRDIPKDGELLLIKQTVEDTVIVEPATLDDCRRILEENGRG